MVFLAVKSGEDRAVQLLQILVLADLDGPTDHLVPLGEPRRHRPADDEDVEGVETVFTSRFPPYFAIHESNFSFTAAWYDHSRKDSRPFSGPHVTGRRSTAPFWTNGLLR